MNRRLGWIIFAAGAVLSVALTLILEQLFLFLLFPFLVFPFLGRRDPSPMHTCPRCGRSSADPEAAYCPRDGTRLE